MDSRKTIQHLYKITDNISFLEKSIVWFFIESKKIIIKNAPELEACKINKSERDIYKPVYDLLSSYYNCLNIDDLIELYELLLPTHTKKVNGAVYTPAPVRRFIVEKSLKDHQPVYTIDPACGCGAFLVTVAEVMHEKYDISYSEAISKYIYGIDIDKNAIRKTKILLSLLSRIHGDYNHLTFNLHCCDFLSPRCSVLLKKQIRQGFDCVIGNPPYVRYRNMDEKSKNNLKYWISSSAGNVDLYMPFFEAGLKLLNKGGKLGFITPNGYIQSVNGRQLRTFLINNENAMEILDFRDNQLFKGVTSYTCISLIDKDDHNKLIKYARLGDKYNTDNYSLSQYSFDLFPNGAPWRVSDNQNDKIIHKLENSGRPLSEWKIRNGLATLKNDVFFFTPAYENEHYYFRIYNDQEYQIEKEVCIKVAKPNIIKNEVELQEKLETAIFPYEYVDNKQTIIPESEFAKRYPKAFGFLNDVKADLEKRDKGHGNYPEWYAYGRTQGMNNFGKKLLIPYIAGTPIAVLCEDPNILFYCGYALFSENDSELRILKKFLESSAFWYYIYNTSKPYSKGFMAFAKNYIVKFSIPELTKEETEYLLSEDDKTKINSFVWSKYGLKEIQLETN